MAPHWSITAVVVGGRLAVPFLRAVGVRVGQAVPLHRADAAKIRSGVRKFDLHPTERDKVFSSASQQSWARALATFVTSNSRLNKHIESSIWVRFSPILRFVWGVLGFVFGSFFSGRPLFSTTS